MWDAPGLEASQPADIYSGLHTKDVLAGPLQALPSRHLKSSCL